MNRFELDFSSVQAIELMPKVTNVNSAASNPYPMSCTNFYTVMHKNSNFEYKLEVYQKGFKTFEYERTYSSPVMKSYSTFNLKKATPVVYYQYDQIFTFEMLPKSALSTQSEIILKPDWEQGTLLEWEISANMGNPFIDVIKTIGSVEIKIMLTRPYYPELDGLFVIIFKVSSLGYHSTKDFDVNYSQYYKINNLSETGLIVLDTSRQITMVKSNVYLDRVVNFGRRCCYNQDIVGPAKFIIDFNAPYPTNFGILIKYKYLMKYESYKSRFVQFKCFLGWKFDDLYIDRKCFIDSDGFFNVFIPPGMALTPGNRIPFTFQFMGEKIGLAGLRATPLNRYAVIYPLNYTAFAGVFLAQTQ